MKTIRQIADELGVSKQTVYKRFKGKLYAICAPYAHMEHGVLYLEEQGEALIKQDFLQKKRSNRAYVQHSSKSALEQSQQSDLITVLQATINTLQGQLEAKDHQIEQQAQTITCLTDALVATQQTAATAQALHAGTMQQQFLSGEDRIDRKGQKRSWISRFFGR